MSATSSSPGASSTSGSGNGDSGDDRIECHGQAGTSVRGQAEDEDVAKELQTEMQAKLRLNTGKGDKAVCIGRMLGGQGLGRIRVAVRDIELIIASGALAISVVAFFVAVMQLLQQYYGSVQGYTSCTSSVIGNWAVFTKRKFKWTQFRFEVRFRVPVIFVAPPQNVYGPLGDDDDKEIVYLDGTLDNYKKTHTWTPEEFDILQNAKLKGADTRETIHAADNELTTWLALLMAIQRMERESKEWQKRINDTYDIPIDVPETENRVTMTVAIQEKTRSWDAMPDGMKKPYAKTAMCHMVEIMAMLGIYWKEFNHSTNMYRARGNGFSVTGSLVPSLGIAFSFEKVGKTWFQENRIIPNDSVKQLCFGFCPTIFQAGLRTPLYTDEPKDEGTLQLGTDAEVAETLVSFGCNTNTVNYFKLGNIHTRYSHLFPIPFEMLGMVGEVLQIRHTAFTMLPNPTRFTYNKSAFSLVSLMTTFQTSLGGIIKEQQDGRRLANSSHLKHILEDIKGVIEAATEDALQKRLEDFKMALNRKNDEAKKMMNRRNHALRKLNPPRATRKQASWPVTWLNRARRRGNKVLASLGLAKDAEADAKQAHQRPLAPHTKPRKSFPRCLDTLHHAIKRCDLFLANNYDLVKHVFALHMEEVLCYLNSRPYGAGEEPATPLMHPDGSVGYGPGYPAGGSWQQQSAHIYSPPPDNKEYYNEQYVPLHTIDTASWTERHQLLMQVYVTFIRKRVMDAQIPESLSQYTYTRRRNLERQDSSALSAMAEEVARNDAEKERIAQAKTAAQVHVQAVPAQSQTQGRRSGHHGKSAHSRDAQAQEKDAQTAAIDAEVAQLEAALAAEAADDETIIQSVTDEAAAIISRSSHAAMSSESSPIEAGPSDAPAPAPASAAGATTAPAPGPMPTSAGAPVSVGSPLGGPAAAGSSRTPLAYPLVRRIATGTIGAAAASAAVAAVTPLPTMPRTVSPVVEAVARSASGSASGVSITGGSQTGANAVMMAVILAARSTRTERDKETLRRPTTAQDIDDIWCTLTFRMICWLMLHDFHKKDAQIDSKSDVYDSRLPVYLL